MRTLRAEQPGLFFCEMCVIFGIFAVIGRTVPGTVLSYCILMSVLIGPGLVIHVLPSGTLERLSSVVSGFRVKAKGAGSDSEADELLPEGSEANMALFQEALDGDSDREDTNEFGLDAESSALTSSAMKGDDSLDTLDDFDLSSPRSKPSLDGDEEPGIQFRSSHFNGDSSEEEEEKEMARGLAFPELQAKQHQQTPRTQDVAGSNLLTGLASNLSSYVGAMGTSLISTVISRAATEAPPKRRKSSTDSNEEFEIIDKEDFS